LSRSVALNLELRVCRRPTALVSWAAESEKWIGEWMESRGVRDQMVVATKALQQSVACQY
jgi:aryl-alcohol dehydrogenase-like predicted oxidoreductase